MIICTVVGLHCNELVLTIEVDYLCYTPGVPSGKREQHNHLLDSCVLNTMLSCKANLSAISQCMGLDIRLA